MNPTTPARPALAIDGSPGTAWETDIYHDPVPFPGFKSGVGLMLKLPQPTVVGAVNVDVASTGTKIQIRSSATATPGKLEDTAVLSQPMRDAPGAQHHSGQRLFAALPMCWCGFRRSGPRDGASRTSLSEVTVQAKS